MKKRLVLISVITISVVIVVLGSLFVRKQLNHYDGLAETASYIKKFEVKLLSELDAYDAFRDSIPEITEIGVDVTVRLNPSLKMGHRIQLDSERVSFAFNNLYFQDIYDSGISRRWLAPVPLQ